MNDYADGLDKANDRCTDLERRSVRALTEKMTVLPKGGDVYTVVSESGSEYRVDGLEGRCTCPDAQHNLSDDGLCKHERRVRFATGQWSIPAWVDTDAIDPLLGDHVDATPTVAATDGSGAQVTTVDHADTTDQCDSDRPDDCACDGFQTDTDIPCWPCYLEGYESPAGGDNNE